jgi:hypothetical protein
MIYIFNDDISDFKELVGGAVNASMDMASLKPSVKDAFYNHVERWLGDAQWKRLVQGKAQDDLTEAEEALLPYVQECVAYLSLYEYVSIGAIQANGSGFQREESENHKTAYKYQVNQYKEYFLINGYEALERMILFLVANELDYLLWQGTEGAAEATALFINDTRTFRRRFNFKITRYTFEHLRGLMKDLDLFIAEAAFGAAFTKDLKDKMRLGTLSTKELELVQWTQRAIAEFAIEQAMRRNMVLLEGDRILIQEALEPQSYKREGLPNARQFSIAVMHHHEWAKRLWSKALDFLNTNIDDFPIYKTYLETLVVEVECAERERNVPADKQFSYAHPTGARSKIVRL